MEAHTTKAWQQGRGRLARRTQNDYDKWTATPRRLQEILHYLNYVTIHKYFLIFQKEKSFKKLQNKWMESNKLKLKCCYFYMIWGYMFIYSLEEKSHFLYFIYIRENFNINSNIYPLNAKMLIKY